MSFPNTPPFSDYLVFVDESGDNGLVRIDPSYPIFVVAYCLIGKEEYVDRVGPRLAQPIGIKVLRPTQANRAYDIVAKKLCVSPVGEIKGCGLKVFP